MRSNTFSCPKSILQVRSCTIYWLCRSSSSAIVYMLSSSRLRFRLCPSLLRALHVCKCLPVVWLGRYFWHERRCYVWCVTDSTCRVITRWVTSTSIPSPCCLLWTALTGAPFSVAKQNSLYCPHDTLENIHLASSVGETHFKRPCDINMVTSRFSETLPK